MIEEAKAKENNSTVQPKKPLIRLRIQYKDDEQGFNTIRFGQKYNERVSNFPIMFSSHFCNQIKIEINIEWFRLQIQLT